MEIIGLLVLVLLCAVYFIPSMVAANGKHPQTGAIVALNIFLGWTFIGWVIALVWAMTVSGLPAQPATAMVTAQVIRKMAPAQATKAMYRKCRHCWMSFPCPIGGDLYYCDNCLAQMVDPTIPVGTDLC
jgi:hypothetical protein